MSRLILKENCLQPMDTVSLPPTRVGRKRRSSILKPQRPFTDVQNLSRGIGGDDSRTAKDRRVSFCPTIEVKEFSKHNPADPTSGDTDPTARSRPEDEGAVKQVSLPSVEDGVPQMSTPVRKKRRRISATSQIARLSIIPKFDKSFAFPDEDFVIFEDSELAGPPPATAPREEITLMEDLPEPNCPPGLEDDVMLDFELNEAPMNRGPPEMNQIAPPLPSEHSPLTNLPIVGENQKLPPRVPVSPPPAGAPTIIGTPAPLSNSHFVAMTTPEMKTTPRRPANRRRINIASDDQTMVTGGEGEGGGVVSMELTADSVAESPLSRGATIAEPRSMDLTCSTSHPPTSENTPTVPTTELTAGSVPAETTALPPSQGLTIAEPHSMDLTCFNKSQNSSTDKNKTASFPTPSAESIPGTIADTVAMSLTGDQLEVEEEEGGVVRGVSRDNHVISVDSAVALPGPQQMTGEGESQVSIDITCLSETTTTSQDTLRTDQGTSPVDHKLQDTSRKLQDTLRIDQDTSPVHHKLQDTSSLTPTRSTTSPTRDTSLPSNKQIDDHEGSRQSENLSKTSAVVDQRSLDQVSVPQGNGSVCENREQEMRLITTTEQVGEHHEVAEQVGEHHEVVGAVHTSPVFKAPRRPLRTQLSLRSSRMRVVIASPVVLTPRATSSFSLSSSHHHPPPTLNTTFTVPSKPLTAAATTPSINPPPTPHHPPSRAKEVEQVAKTVSSEEATMTNAVSSLLASPASGPSPLAAVPATHPCTAMFESPGDSFNLIHSGDETLTTTQEEELCPPETPQQVETDSQGNITSTSLQATPAPAATPVIQTTPAPQQIAQATPVLRFITPCPQPVSLATPAPWPIVQGAIFPIRRPSEVSQATPVYNHISGQTAQLVAAINRLKVSGPPVVIPEIVTPEVALVADPPPPAVPDLSILSRSVRLNDTTLCSNDRSPFLSTSVYNKFLAKIYEENILTPAADESKVSTPEPMTVAAPQAPGIIQPQDTEKTDATSRPTGPVSTTLFSSFLSDLTSRLQDMLHGIQQRLSSLEYCATHKCLSVVLDKWSRIFTACLGTLTVLELYGKLSGESNTHNWVDEGQCSEHMPLPAIGQEDIEQDTLSIKLEWIMELGGFYSTMCPIAELARDRAAELYGWLFEEWSYDTHAQNVTVVLGSTPYQFHVSVSDMVADRFAATHPVAQAVWSDVQNYGLPPS